MVRLSIPSGCPVPLPEFPRPYRARGNFGKGAAPESAGFGPFRELRESDAAALESVPCLGEPVGFLQPITRAAPLIQQEGSR